MKRKIPTFIGLFALLVALGLGVFLVQYQKTRTASRAGEEATPTQVIISNQTESSFSVTWYTSRKTIGFVLSGEKEGSLSKNSPTLTNIPANWHHSKIVGLAPLKNYFFKINSEGVVFTNQDRPWQAKTAKKKDKKQTSDSASGIILDPDGNKIQEGVVTLSADGSNILSSPISENGTWSADLSNFYREDLANPYDLDQTKTILSLKVYAAPLGEAFASAKATNVKPSDPIVIGKSHDFTGDPGRDTGNKPESDPQTPGKSQKEGFSYPSASPKIKGVVTLDSVDNEEIVTTQRPEFFGEGPAGVTLTITLESETIQDTAKISQNGSWKWSPSSNLSPGTHKITVSWRDASGILKTLERTFIVQAGESPSFESSPSAGLTTPTPSPTPTPSSSGTPLATGTLAATGTTTTSAPPQVPDSGSLTPTLLLLIMGLGVITGGILLFN